MGLFEKKNNKGDDDWSDIEQVIDALDADSYDDVAEIVNIEKFLTFWCAEVILGHIDGYSNNMNNYYIYLTEEGKFEFIPWGADQVFMSVKEWDISRMSIYKSVMVQGRLSYWLYTEYEDLFVSEMETRLNSCNWNVTEIIIWATEMTEIATAHGSGYDYGDDTEDFPESDYDKQLEIISNWITARRDDLLDEILPTPVEWDTEWTPRFYNIFCLGIFRDSGGSDCITIETRIYSTEEDCEEDSSSISYSSDEIVWAKTCDEVLEVYDEVVANAGGSSVGNPSSLWGNCFTNFTESAEIYKYACSSGCEDSMAIIVICSLVGVFLLGAVLVGCYWHKKGLANAVTTSDGDGGL